MVSPDFNDLNLEEESRFDSFLITCDITMATPNVAYVTQNLPLCGKCAFKLLESLLNCSKFKPIFCCRYIGHAGKCHYIVDLENSAVTELQPRYADSSNWTVQAGLKHPILLNATCMEVILSDTDHI